MVFSSIVFLVYFLPVFLLCYFFADRRFKNGLLILASIIFYAWGAPKFIFVILLTTFIDFYLVALMDRQAAQTRRKALLILSVSINLGLLFYFKYSGFFMDNINALFGLSSNNWPQLVLPIGISFYTFESVTYAADVYRRIHKPLAAFSNYQLYIILFPKLIAGPIVRYHEIADQLTNRFAHETVENRLTGFYRFVFGLAKKVLIANSLGRVADEIFWQGSGNLDMLTAWAGSLAYTFQIYYDFSGYSDMAIGLAKMLGFIFPENFNNPYISQSITEFWRRWHITLGKWMKNYLYIPLGGNRVKSKARLFFNLWLVFLASGLWHGASWNFILWGAFHGFFMVLERSGYGRFLTVIGEIPALLLTFIIVNTSWVFFKVTDLNEGFQIVTKLFTFSSLPATVHFDREFIFYLALAAALAFCAVMPFVQRLQAALYFNAYTPARHLLVFFICVVLFVACLASLASAGFNPFIYFRF